MTSRQEQKRVLRVVTLEDISDTARRVLSSASDQSVRLKDNFIGDQHILLALMKDKSVMDMLKRFNLDPDKITRATEFVIRYSGVSEFQGEIGLTARGKKVIALAVDEARRRPQGEIVPIDLLAGILRESEGIASGVLGSMTVNEHPDLLSKIRIYMSADRTTVKPKSTPSA